MSRLPPIFTYQGSEFLRGDDREAHTPSPTVVLELECGGVAGAK